MLPHDCPQWQTVYYYLNKWTYDGTVEQVNDQLRERTRLNAGRKSSPCAALIDSQRVKTTRIGGAQRSFDGGKKIKRGKRHIITDTQGLLLSAVSHTANTHDSQAAPGVIETLKHRFLRLTKIFADGGYRGAWIENMKKFCGRDMEITLRSDKTIGFEVLPVRRVVERSFSWLEYFRRPAKDYRYTAQISETMIYLAFTTIMLHRI
jgi:putative transposase